MSGDGTSSLQAPGFSYRGGARLSEDEAFIQMQLVRKTERRIILHECPQKLKIDCFLQMTADQFHLSNSRTPT